MCGLAIWTTANPTPTCCVMLHGFEDEIATGPATTSSLPQGFQQLCLRSWETCDDEMRLSVLLVFALALAAGLQAAGKGSWQATPR